MYIFIFIGLILIISFIILIFKKNIENMTSDDAIQKIIETGDTNNLTVKNLIATGKLNFLKKGIIVAWTGSNIPAGWALCNGQNGTPDLRGRFIIGTDEYKEAASADAMRGYHSNSRSGMFPLETKGGGIKRESPPRIYNLVPPYLGKPKDLLPPYYALAFIMKL